jgi:hypothetical protein
MGAAAGFGTRADTALRRNQWAAQPEERVLGLHLSTLFPQLPRADMAAFRLSLLLGAAIVVAIAAAGFYPVAFVGALVLVPMLLVFYMWDVDVYEDESRKVLAFTVSWGIVTGFVAGLILRQLLPVQFSVSGGYATTTILTHGVLIPLLGAGLILVGPLLLLPYRRFNDVLDGASVGATTAVGVLAALALGQGLELFSGGLQPGSDPLPWVTRLILLGIAAPLLAAGAFGAACGAIWLRYRAPLRDRRSLGVLGSPVVAAAAAAGLLVLSALGQMLLPDVASVLWLLILAGIALIWLRSVIHLGLLEEAAEIEIGPPIACPNCGRMTPAHSFCGNCGISLRALPKARSTRAPAVEPGATTS